MSWLQSANKIFIDRKSLRVYYALHSSLPISHKKLAKHKIPSDFFNSE